MLNKLNICLILKIILMLSLLSTHSFALNLNDSGKISVTNVSNVIKIKSETDILNAIHKANTKHLPITIMGVQHSQGGQTLAENAIVLDMLLFNKVLNVDVAKKQVTVQSGITWAALQKYINRYNLAVKSMQSPNIFTVGGSISVNAHGDDFRAGAVGNSLIAFDIILANGKKVTVTRNTNPQLWSAVIGGYGLFGIITNVTLQLTNNDWLVSHYQAATLDDLPTYFNDKILKNDDIALFYAHLNIVPNKNFLQDMYVIYYSDTHKIPDKIIPLDDPDKWNAILTPVFNISRHSSFGKQWRFNTEKKVFSRIYDNKLVTRNNAMEKPVSFASSYSNKIDADWLQEYFIPVNKLPEFINKIRSIILENNINLLNVTIRYVPAEPEIILSYAKENCFAVVLYFNQKLTAAEIESAKSWTQQLIAAAISLNGTYYLPYQNFASDAQFEQIYPGYKNILELKKHYDPKTLFTNKFYQRYFK